MQDIFKGLKGQFCIQCYKGTEIIDSFEDHNYIMTTARQSVAELYVGANSRRLTKLVLGTSGSAENDIYTPITEATGFSRDLTRLFSDYRTYNIGNNFTIFTGQVIKVNNTLYKYIGESKTITLSSGALNNLNLFVQFSITPYLYELNVRRYTDVIFNGTTNYAENTDKGSANISYDNDKTITYTFEIPTSEGNGQNTNQRQSFFNEAGLYINERLFAMKCFPAKLKDESTSFKIIWKILF